METGKAKGSGQEEEEERLRFTDIRCQEPAALIVPADGGKGKHSTSNADAFAAAKTLPTSSSSSPIRPLE